jgi:hypothetical protein
VDWKICDRKHSRPIWSTMWIRSDDIGWCYDLISGNMWIGTDDIGCSHDLIVSATWIGKDVTRRIHDQFEVIWDLEVMIKDDVMN